MMSALTSSNTNNVQPFTNTKSLDILVNAVSVLAFNISALEFITNSMRIEKTCLGT